MGNVVISPDIQKTSERINTNGDIINPRTKVVIKPNAPEYIPTPEEIAKAIAPKAPESPTSNVNEKSSPMDIQAQIEQAKANLAHLEDLKKQKIEEMKKELKALEQ